MKIRFLILFSIGALNPQSFATQLKPVFDKGGFLKLFALYSFGTHEGSARPIEGQAEIDTASKNIVSAFFSVPLSSIDMGKTAMNCHFQ